MKTYFKFVCIYCGQHMECKPRLCGCQILCPACGLRIVIPAHPARPTTSQPALARDAWDTSVPIPLVEIPTRYRHRMARNAVLA
jgi:DNA-directed RNA polymerase subunit RPC12/RpoP